MLDGTVQLRAPAFPLLHLSADTGIRGTRFEAVPCCDAPSVRERVADPVQRLLPHRAAAEREQQRAERHAAGQSGLHGRLPQRGTKADIARKCALTSRAAASHDISR